MKKILKILLILIILGVSALIFYRYQSEIRTRISPAVNKVITEIGIVEGPCKNPINYSLGTFDAKFGISQKYFLNALTDAEAIWEKAFGRELFAYEPLGKESGLLKVNLTYDFRQEATSKLAGLGIVVSDNRATYDKLKIKFNELETKFETAKSDYETLAASFSTRQDAYNQKVDNWNSQGGAPPGEFEKLEAEKSALDLQLSQLRSKEAQMNVMIDDINAVVVVLNRLAKTLNISVDNYNTIGAARGESFEEAIYQSDGANQKIDVYEFGSRAKLVRVLAHELGHALGLPHVDDPKSIMYKLNQSSNIIPTKGDLAALKNVCGV